MNYICYLNLLQNYLNSVNLQSIFIVVSLILELNLIL